MYPNRLLADTESAAERRLYGVFSNQVSDQFTVFHSVSFLALGADNCAYDGEADFVVAHPELGVLIVEVKGGRIQYDGESGQWSSIDRYDRRHLFARSPFEQARNARYNLYRKLKGTSSTIPYHYPVYHAVCFPDIEVTQDMGLDAPVDIVVDQKRLSNLEPSVRDIFGYWQGGAPSPGPGSSGIKALIELIAPRFELRSNLRNQLSDEAAEIKVLTEQQFRTLNLLSRQRHALVFGCAGSGKTLLAMEKAQRLANEGYAVLVTCFNARLAEWMSASLNNCDNITVKHFHRLCIDLAHQAGITVPPLDSDVVQGDKEFFFGTLLPDALLQSIDRSGTQFNAIVADEGQDFYDEWWTALQALLSDPDDDIFYIFADDNQNIYAGSSQGYPFGQSAITLDTNCRNTQHIHDTVMRFYRGDIPIQSNGPIGRVPEFLDLSPTQGLIETLRKRTHDLINAERINARDIVVLTPCSRSRSQLREGTKVGNTTLTWSFPVGTNQMLCSTIHSFKGLERPVVILAELDQISKDEREKILYIGLSRATHHLIILGAL